MACWHCCRVLKQWLGMITVEPTMILYMMAFMTTTVIEQAFFIDKACRVNHNFTREICDNLTSKDNADFNAKVQVTVSEFHQWNDIAGHGGPIILAFFMGAWSDKRGRKLPLIIGLIGKLYYSSMIVLNTVKDDWPVEYIIYTATLPMAFTGADVAIFAAAFTYLTDVTSSTNRTMRVTILEVCYLATMPTGIALGSFLFSQVTGRSYTIMFAINITLLVLSIVYSLIFLRWFTTDRQRPVWEADNVLLDFFDYKHAVATVTTLTMWRPKNRRTYLILLIASMGFYSFQRDEKQMSYLYMQHVLKWTFEQISVFRTYVSAVQDVVLLVAVPVLSKYMNWRDTAIMIVGAICHTVARIFYATAHIGWLIYIGGAFAAIGPIVAPVIRSMVSKLVSANERGKVFSLLSVTDNAIPMISGVIYNQVYSATIHSAPSAIFLVTIATQVLVLLIATFIHVRAEDNKLTHEDKEEEVNEQLEADTT